MKNFFKKVKEYIKNTAWIQPLLIVVIIFVVLFSLNPITAGIKNAWTSMTSVNNMEKISYDQYTKMVKAQAEDANAQDFIIVFSDSKSDDTPVFYKSMNKYLKTPEYKNADFKIYSVNITQRSTYKKIKGVKCYKFKDRTIGLSTPAAKINDSAYTTKDSLYSLDRRLEDMSLTFGDSGSNKYSELGTASYMDAYSYINGVTVLWYSHGIETRACNSYTSLITIDSTGKKATAASFANFIEEFDGELSSNKETVSDYWNEKFELVSQKG